MNYRAIRSLSVFSVILGASLSPHAIVVVRVNVSVGVYHRNEVEVEVVEDAVVLGRIVEQLVDHVRQSSRSDPFSGVDSYWPHQEIKFIDIDQNITENLKIGVWS